MGKNLKDSLLPETVLGHKAIYHIETCDFVLSIPFDVRRNVIPRVNKTSKEDATPSTTWTADGFAHFVLP